MDGVRKGRSLDVEKCLQLGIVETDNVIRVLENRGFPHYLTKIINSYLNRRRILLRDNDGNTEEVVVTRGVPQCSILAPSCGTYYTMKSSD